MMFLVGVVLTCEAIANKANLKKTTVDIGSGRDPLVIVTNAPNIREGTRTVVAMIGSEIEVNGETITISKTVVGGVSSEGMICDSVMLGWSGGAAGICVQIPASFELGAAAPSQKPRQDGGTTVSTDREEPKKSDKEVKAEEKARKKADLAARREELKAKKAAKKAAENESGEAVAEGEAATVEKGDVEKK